MERHQSNGEQVTTEMILSQHFVKHDTNLPDEAGMSLCTVKTNTFWALTTGSLQKNATLLHHYNLGLKLINCLISLTYVAELRQILIIQFIVSG